MKESKVILSLILGNFRNKRNTFRSVQIHLYSSYKYIPLPALFETKNRRFIAPFPKKRNTIPRRSFDSSSWKAIRYLAPRQKRSRSARFLISFQLENHESHGRSKVPSDGETLRLFNLSSEFPFIPYPHLPLSPLSSPFLPRTVPFLFSFSSIPLFFPSSLFVHLLSRSIHATLYRSFYLDSKVSLT